MTLIVLFQRFMLLKFAIDIDEMTSKIHNKNSVISLARLVVTACCLKSSDFIICWCVCEVLLNRFAGEKAFLGTYFLHD